MGKLASDEIAMLDPYKFMLGHSTSIMARVAARPANIRKTVWLMPRMAKAVPYLGYLVVAATKPG